MGSNEQKFKYDSNYRKESSFTHIKFGHDLPLLETELNEAQILQEKARTSLARRLTLSGFTELTSKGFNGPSLLYSPLDSAGNVILNHIAIAPSKAIINGYELALEGNFKPGISSENNPDNYILINLGEASDNYGREDLVYLEVWFKILAGVDNIQEYGYINGNYMGYSIIDPRVNAETTRRVALYWNVKVANNVMFDQYPNGFGYDSEIEAYADGGLTFDYIPNEDIVNQHNPLIFINANNDYYKECEFYQDYNLYVAGRPNQLLKSSSLYDGYVFAMPLFKVIRRNKNPYSIENISGAISKLDIHDSIINGDLSGGIPPDKSPYDSINQKDILDLRHIVNLKEPKYHYYLEKTINKLFAGNLKTKNSDKVRRVQFGMQNIDYSEYNGIQYSVNFNGNLIPFAPNMDASEIEFNVSDINNINYVDSLNGYGLHLNGSNYIRYNLYNNININEGSIDFYFQPYWHGPDNINQTIFKITNLFNIPIFIFEKKGKHFVWTQYFGDNTINTIQIDLTNPILTSTLSLICKNIYHIRLTWSSSNNSSNIYINGNCVSGINTYSYNTLNEQNPYWIQFGKSLNNENTNDTGFVIENFILYNLFLQEENLPKLPKDFISNNSLLLPSFNSNVNNFSDNLYIQHKTTTLLDSTGGRIFLFNIPDGEVIDETSNLITTDYITGLPVDGIWEDIDNTTKSFTAYSDIDQISLQYTIGGLQTAVSTIVDIDTNQTEIKNIFEFLYPIDENVDVSSMSVYDIDDGAPLYLAYSSDNQSGVWLNIDGGIQFIPEVNNVSKVLLTYKNNINSPGTPMQLSNPEQLDNVSKFTFEIPAGKTIETGTVGVNGIKVVYATTQEVIAGYWISIDNDTKQFITEAVINDDIEVHYTVLSEDKSIILNASLQTIEHNFIFTLPENKIIDTENIQAMTVVNNGETSVEIDGNWSIIDENTLQFATISNNIEQILVQYTIIGEIKTAILYLKTDLSGEFIFNIPYGKSIDNTSLVAYNNQNGNILNGIWSNVKAKFIANQDINSIILKYNIKYNTIINKQESLTLDKELEPINERSIFNFNISSLFDHDSLQVYNINTGNIINNLEYNLDYSQFTVYDDIEHVLLKYVTIINTPNNISINKDSIEINDISQFTFITNGQTIDLNNIIVKNSADDTEVSGSWININDNIKQFITQELVNSISFLYNIITTEDNSIVLARDIYSNDITFKLSLVDNISGNIKIINDIQVNTVNDPIVQIDGNWVEADENNLLFITSLSNINQINVNYNIIGEKNKISLTAIDSVPNTFLFDINNIPSGVPLIVDTESLQVYDANETNIIDGTWVEIVKKFNTIKNVYKILLQYDLILPPGNGGYDLPNEMVGAGIVSFDTNVNSTIQEISYCERGTAQSRNVTYIGIGKTNGIIDRAYDYPLTYVSAIDDITEQERCFARLLYYHISGNGTNTYIINNRLYGYEVIGIIEVVNKKLKYCKKLSNGSFSIELTSAVGINDIIEFKLALGGLTFEYEARSKTLISNIHKTKILQFIANGIDKEYIIPAYEQHGNGGIIKSIFTFTNNELDNTKTKHNIYFIKKNNTNINTMFILNDPQNFDSGYKMAEYNLQNGIDSFGTPFLKIILDDLPEAGDIIEIPVLISYQPTEDTNISLWYNYTPYQGILSNTTKQLKRLTDWKYFITTLSSGNVNYIINDNVYSFSNIINRIPGGMTYAYCTTGESVAFQYISDTFLNDNIDDQLIFTNNVFFSNVTNDLNNTIFPLITDLNISKSAKGFQDGILTIQDFSIFLPECLSEISKYIGMACIVVDENGELLLLVIGNLDKNASKINELIPTYGDLFRIQGLPTIVKEVL